MVEHRKNCVNTVGKLRISLVFCNTDTISVVDYTETVPARSQTKWTRQRLCCFGCAFMSLPV